MNEFARRILVCLALWLALVLCAAGLWHRPLLLAAIYLVASVFLLSLWRSRHERLVYLGGFVLGPAGEMVAISSGAWSYADPLWLVPAWLPPAWGLAAMILMRLATSGRGLSDGS